MPLIPGTGFMSLLLTGGGCRMGFGARVRQTGRPAAHIKIPVIPKAREKEEQLKQDRREAWKLRGQMPNSGKMQNFVTGCRIQLSKNVSSHVIF